jgi:cell division septation protein DedD
MSRDYREIQVSTSILVFIILGILILGTVIFFIGVQVGKKQADLMSQTVIAQKTLEKLSPSTTLPPQEEQVAAASSSLLTATQPGSESQKPGSGTAKESSSIAATGTQDTATPSETRTPASTTTSTSQKATSTTKSSSVNYFIQVGAFNDRSSARLAAERYRKQGYTAVVKEPFAKDRKPLYRIWLGSYRTREEAQKVLNELVSKSVRNPGFFIIQQ